MHFRHPFALGRHVQLLDDLIADHFHLWGHRVPGFPRSACLRMIAPNIPTRGQPFPIVPADRPPSRRPVVLNSIRDRSGDGLNRCTRYRDRLLPVNLLQVLDAALGQIDQFWRIDRKVSSELFRYLLVELMASLTATINDKSLVAN